MRIALIVIVFLLAPAAPAAERLFNFSDEPVNSTPPDFRSTVAGTGKPGEWKIVADDVPSLMAPLTVRGTSTTKRPVLAQTGGQAMGEHFPMLIFSGDTYEDF